MSALNRKEIIESVKESLQNLGLGYIDLILVHKTDPHCPIEGKVRHLLHKDGDLVSEQRGRVGSYRVNMISTFLTIVLSCSRSQGLL